MGGQDAEYFRTLVENATDLIAVLTPNGTFRFVSGSVTAILGYRPEDLVGTNAFDLVHPDDRPDVLEAIRAGLEHRDTGLPMTFQAHHRDGSWRFLEATDRNLLDVEAIGGIVISGRDVTERVHAENELRENDRRKDEFDARGHQLTLQLPSEPLRVVGDPVRLPQIVANILNNAAKYTEGPGYVRLSVERRGGQAEIRIRDDGIGISAELLPRVFDLFVQADGSLRRSHGGLGVGLNLARRLAEMHGGTIEAASEGAGQGSEFVVRLPLLSAAPAEAPASVDAPAANPVRRVLVVDDNVDAADSLAMMLRLMGHEAETAYDGPSAIQTAARMAPDLVLLDIGLPGLDGYEVARRLRARLGTTPALVAVTGYGQEQDRLRSRAAGFDDHVVKPVDEAVLTRVLAGRKG